METLSKEQIQFFWNNGYLIIDTGIPERTLDAVREDLADYWAGKRSENMSYVTSSRIQDAWRVSTNVKEVACFQPTLDKLESLYGRKAKPFQTLNFPKGTEQKVHADTIHFNSEPFGMMCGVWVALEDVGADQGPLIYYPGSQALPEMNFEDAGIEPDYDNYPSYEKFIEELLEKYGFRPVYGLVKKGQAVIWAANLLHGGAPQTNKALSRHSQVTHYYFDSCNYWRPGYSGAERFYYEPCWVGSIGGERVGSVKRSRIARARKKLKRMLKRT